MSTLQQKAFAALDKDFPLIKFDPDMPRKELDWLVQGLWQVGKINMVSGYVKSGKTRFTNWILAGMHNGYTLDLPCQTPNRVLYLCGEEDVQHVNNRLAQYAIAQSVPLKVIDIDFMPATGLRLNNERYQQWFRAKLSDYDLLIIDPLRRVHSANENDNTEMALLNTAIRQWSNELKLSMVIIHHTPKPSDFADMNRMENWIRGAGDIAAIVDTAVFVDKGAGGKVSIKREGRFAPLPPLAVFDKGNDPDEGFCRDYTSKESKKSG